MSAVLLRPGAELRRSPGELFDDLRSALTTGARLVSFFGREDDDPAEVMLTAVTQDAGGLRAIRATVNRASGFHSLTREFPALHIFEREVYEQHGLKPHDHPWLKPVRFSGKGLGKTGTYPFYEIEGKEVHEVAVGPIHAGVIEPGHFRFMCLGETVHHLEIQLGFQHRAVEHLLLRRDHRSLTPLVETIAGDTSVAHAWAHCEALEALAGLTVSDDVELSRGMALELERIAMHLAGLAGLCNDIAFLQGASTYGRLRTTAINTSMLLCGSRFGRGWLRPGGVRARMDAQVRATVIENLALLERDLAIIHAHFLAARSVQHRFQGTGVVTKAAALELGVVGLAARASGVDLDMRQALKSRPFEAAPVATVVEPSGDCWARARVRIREIDASLIWLKNTLEHAPMLTRRSAALEELAPETLAIAVQEGWRGEVVHCVETDRQGRLRHYKVQDPSLRNWFGLALALRGNDISDFPICNKSFDLSYCGNDL
jgi:Ni,Fe-hydrogenase III large subunit